MSRSNVETRGGVPDSVISRSTVKAGGAIEGSVVHRSDVSTERAAIRDAVISHSTITQTETHQHFGESVGTYEAQMDLAKTAFEGRNWDEAVEFFNAALRINSRSFEPWYFKGLSCAELRRTDESVTNLRRALKLAGSDTGCILGEVRGLVDRIFKAATLQEAQANELLGKAQLELQYSYNTKTTAQAEKSGALIPSLALDLLVLPGLGSSMRTTKAVEGLERKQEADKREAEGKKLEDQAKGYLSEAVKLYNSAIRFCDLVLEVQRQDEFSWMKRGEIFMRLRLYNDACQSYEALLAFNPYQREALRLRGACFTAQGRPIPPPPAAPAPAGALPPAAGPVSPQPMARPVIPSPMPPAQQPAPALQPQTAMMPPVTPGRAPQMAPSGPQPPAVSRAPAGPAAATAAQSSPQQPRPAGGPAPAAPPPVPGAPTQPAAPAAQRPPAAPGAYSQRPAGGQSVNPCPNCRGEMSFMRDKGVWLCGSCRQYSAKPAR